MHGSWISLGFKGLNCVSHNNKMGGGGNFDVTLCVCVCVLI